ncbi:lanthionine synthetase LanC family protein [Streptomyces sp. UH6]|uniref:class III lanthionine synthetase LanKC N-terminal domain-containing protein n=1 Tax=Streptomyces sp. UH6 TaxID=2748379 RepID=UPI0015D48C60|nr:lanthionine synthetase LanC family protein [Streptomyces sp. UH6]NYV72855.1 protein kinase/lanthionine synthetase C family protein [Streptomyces sp. UH6]
MDRLAGTATHHYGLVDSRYYEPLSRRPITPEYRDALHRLLPEDWALRHGDIWLHALRPPDTARREAETPAQGFKIHVSSSPAHALRLLDLVVPVCVDHGVAFKTAADPVLLGVLNSKLQERGRSGKFMTVYPPDEQVFTELIEALYRRTVDEAVEGPYILSDRRYRDSRVLFYRYGGFRPPRRLNVDGTQSFPLTSPTGTHVADERLPYFQLPHWVRDPFASPSGTAPGDAPADGPDTNGQEGDGPEADGTEGAGTVLHGRYRVEGALAFSNAGGVYHGTDTLTSAPVVVKEARRLTNSWTSEDRTWDAVDVLCHEYDMVCHLRGLDFVPRPVDLFREWEHTFLVEERVEGIALHDFWARDDTILAPYIRRQGRLDRFVPRFREVAERLITMVEEVHARGVLLGDLSPNNILIDPVTLRMRFIDFECAVREDDEAAMLEYGGRLGTPGFVHPERPSRDRLLPHDDWYAVGMILYGCVLPVTALFGLNPAAEERFLDEFVALGVPARVKALVTHLTAGSVDAAKAVLATWDEDGTDTGGAFGAGLRPTAGGAPPERAPDGLVPEVHRTLDGLVDGLLRTADDRRSDRLWPSDPMVFATHPLGVAHGACGPALLLDAVTREPLPEEITSWMLRRPVGTDTCPPGLYLGLAGIAWTFHDLGLTDRAEELMAALYASPLLYEEPGVFLGAAGWGTAALRLHAATGAQVHLDHAVRAGEHLLTTAQHDGATSYWRCGLDDSVHHGHGYGASGIALFLLHLHHATGDDRYRSCAVRALEFDLAHATVGELGMQWPRIRGGTVVYPYWIHGSAGVGSTLVRFHHVLGGERYGDLARRVADDTYVKYTYTPGLFEGLSGIGEFMLDMHCFTGEERYRRRALDIAETLLWFAVESEDGTAFPGRSLTRVSHDYATGSAGVGLFLSRLVRPRARAFVDLDATAPS